MFQPRLSANTPTYMARFVHKTGLPATSSCPQWTSCAWRYSSRNCLNVLKRISCSSPVMALPVIPQESSGFQAISCWQNYRRKALTSTQPKITGTTCVKNSSTISSSIQCRQSKTSLSPPATSTIKIPTSSIPSRLGTGLLIPNRLLIGIICLLGR